MTISWLVAAAVVLAPLAASAETADEVVTGVEKFYAGVDHATTRFQQLVTDPTFGGPPAVSAGTVLVKKPGKMRWDYDAKRKGQKPKKNFIADGKDLYYVDHVNKQVFITKLDASMMPAAVTFLLGKGALSKDFTATLATSATYGRTGQTVVELTPTQPSAAYKQVVLVVGADHQVAQTIVIDSADRVNQFEFEPADYKASIDAKQFRFDRKQYKTYKIVKK